jgi:hypothetical protein
LKVVNVADVPAHKQESNKGEVGSVRPGGTVLQHLVGDDAPDGLNFRLLRVQFQPGPDAYDTPRHHHAFQQLRWAESGDLNFAPGQNIPQGAIAYFPRGTWYGPQHKDSGISISLQFGFHGEQQSGPAWAKVRDHARAALAARGTFERGVYIETDPHTGEKSERDAVQALFEAQYEARYGRKWITPPEGYEAPILMHPEAFDYFETARGVQIRRFGSFYDHPGPNADIRVSMLRLAKGAATDFGPERAQVLWSTGAGLGVGDTTHPELTFVYSPRDEKVELSSDVGGLEVFVVEFPRLD